jgi:hypothetical protein
LRIGGKDAHLFLRTYARAALNGRFERVERVSGSNFMPGNIIFDIVLAEPANLTVAHITQAYQLRPSQAELGQQLLEKAQQRKLLGLEINPSYGAECRALFRTVAILPNHILPSAIAEVST